MQPSTSITPENARSIAREAYTFGFPMVESYKTLYKQAIDTSSSDFKAPINQIGCATGVVTPDDKQFITPNTDTPQYRYTLRFEKNQLPPANAFWSITMYDGKTQLLVRNPLQRYVLNSPMLETFKFGEDGSLTFYIQKDSPGGDREPNWLPAPDSPFYLIMRLYLPKPEVLNGIWKQPPLQRVQ